MICGSLEKSDRGSVRVCRSCNIFRGEEYKRIEDTMIDAIIVNVGTVLDGFERKIPLPGREGG